MSRKLANKVIADGIGKRLIELGFERKSARRYFREDERFRESVSFEVDGYGRFADFLGVFDKELAALFRPLGWSEEETAGFRNPAPAHAGRGTTSLWRANDEARETEWRSGLKWWNPVDWFSAPPELTFSKSDLHEKGLWNIVDHPDVVGDACLNMWVDLMEPWRERIRSDKAFLVKDFSRWPNGGGSFKQILCHIYLGERAAAAKICREILDEEGVAPTEAELKRRRQFTYSWTRPEEEFIEGRIRASFNAAEKARRLAAAYELDP